MNNYGSGLLGTPHLWKQPKKKDPSTSGLQENIQHKVGEANYNILPSINLTNILIELNP